MPLHAQMLYSTLISAAFLSGTLAAVVEYLIHGMAHPTYLFVIPALLLTVGVLAIYMYCKELSAEKKDKQTFE